MRMVGFNFPLLLHCVDFDSSVRTWTWTVWTWTWMWWTQLQHWLLAAHFAIKTNENK